MLEFNEVNIPTGALQLILGVGIPAVLLVFFTALTAFGGKHVAQNLRDIWRVFYPLLDEATDPLVIAVALAVKYTPEELVEISKKWNQSIDPVPAEVAVQKYAHVLGPQLEVFKSPSDEGNR